MTVGGINGRQSVQAGQLGVGNQNDPVAKGIQEQIQKKEQELKELSANREMSGEQKQKKMQQLRQEISDLTMQLRQHQIEQRQKEREEKQQSMDEMMGTDAQQRKMEKDGVSLGLSSAGMEALLSADSARKQADVQGSVASKMEGKANVLEMEIKQDMAAGASNTEAKEVQIADLRAKAQSAQASQIGKLSEAVDSLEQDDGFENGIAVKREGEEKEESTKEGEGIEKEEDSRIDGNMDGQERS